MQSRENLAGVDKEYYNICYKHYMYAYMYVHVCMHTRICSYMPIIYNMYLLWVDLQFAKKGQNCETGSERIASQKLLGALYYEE